MSTFLSTLQQSVERHKILPGERLMIACSGGADSTVLLHAFLMLPNFQSPDIVVAHFNHGLRGEESDADEEFVKDLSQSLQVAVVTEKATDAYESEEQLRNARYQFLKTAAADDNCPTIALGHHGDDQTETVLHNIVRGTGLRGLAGIPAERKFGSARIVRPLLHLTRRQILDFAECHKVSFRADSSNRSLDYTRNRIRQNTLPQLTEDINSSASENLRSLGREAAECLNYLDEIAQSVLSEAIIERQPDSCRLSTSVMCGQPPFLRRHVFRLLWQQQLWPLQKMTASHWYRLADEIQQPTRFDLPGDVTFVSDPRLTRLFKR